ncbi:MAG: glycerophosphodiester phosphodiesterase [Pseudomonadota bacterium]
MSAHQKTTSFRLSALMAAAALVLAACGGSDDPGPLPFKTLAGVQPTVVGHRGASGHLPEHTLESYSRAIEMGADFVEPDLVVTKDGILIARHEPNITSTTNVAALPKFASRKTTKKVDGVDETGWFASDFTLAEIKELGALITDAERPQQFNGLYKIPTLQEIVDLVKARRASTGRDIGIYPETKHPTFHRALGLGLEDRLISALNAAGWNSRTAPVLVQSFEPGSLKEMKSKGLTTRMIQLIDADDYDLKAGKLSYAAPYDRPYDWAVSGDKRMFSDMVTPAGLAEIKTYADGIGPWKPYIVPIKATLDASGNIVDRNGDGKRDYNDASSQPATSLIEDAHKAGLLVHAYTFRNEQRRLAFDYNKDPKAEYLQFYHLGLDGLFSDFPDTAIDARATYLRELNR